MSWDGWHGVWMLCCTERSFSFVKFLAIAGCCAKHGVFQETSSQPLLTTSMWPFSLQGICSGSLKVFFRGSFSKCNLDSRCPWEKVRSGSSYIDILDCLLCGCFGQFFLTLFKSSDVLKSDFTYNLVIVKWEDHLEHTVCLLYKNKIFNSEIFSWFKYM